MKKVFSHDWGRFYHIRADGYFLSSFSADSYLGVAPAFRIMGYD